MKAPILVSALALLIIQCRFAAATSYPVLYVATNGLAAWPCGTEPSQPCKSIATAVSKAASYATTMIKVAQGAYAENIDIAGNLPFPHSGPLSIEGGWNADFTMQGRDPALTKITSANSNSVITITLLASELVDLRLAYLTLQGTSELQRLGIQVSALPGTMNLAIDHCRLASYRGQAVSLVGNYLSSLTFTLDDSTLEGNYQWPTNAPWPGAGVYAYLLGGSTGTFTLARNRIIGNQASAGGGLLFLVDGATLTATLENNILAGNQASGGGGAIAAETAGSGKMDLFLTNNTLTNNSAVSQGAGIDFIAMGTSSLTAYLKNSIVWETGTDLYLERFAGLNTLAVTADYSIIGDVANSSGATYTPKSSVIDTDPLLNPACHLAPGSPARDRGICGIKIPILNTYIYSRIAPYKDIDGDPRPGFNTILGCDIGADEYKFPWTLYHPSFMNSP